MKPKFTIHLDDMLRNVDRILEDMDRRMKMAKDSKGNMFGGGSKGRQYNSKDFIRIASGQYKPAVLKVVSYGRKRSDINNIVNYVMRESKLPLETETGEQLLEKEDCKLLLDEWEVDFSRRKSFGSYKDKTGEKVERKRPREAMHMMLSFPKSERDIEKIRNTVRNFLQRQFADAGFRYLFVIHEDREHNHAHVLIKMSNELSLKRMQTTGKILEDWRFLFAECAREQGIMLTANRSIHRSLAKNSVPLNVIKTRERFERDAVSEGKKSRVPLDIENKLKSKVMERIKNNVPFVSTSSEQKLAKSWLREKERFMLIANIMEAKAGEATGDQKIILQDLSKMVRLHSQNMEFPFNRVQQQIIQVARDTGVKVPGLKSVIIGRKGSPDIEIEH